MHGIIPSPGGATRPMKDELPLPELMHHFIAHTLPKSRWTHHAHMAAALGHVLEHGGPEALTLMRERIMSYNLATGGKPTDYHETVTAAWVRLIADFAARHARVSAEELRKRMLEELGGRDQLLRHYSRGLIGGDAARSTFVEPDLLPLPDWPPNP